jgi:sigma-B regulation protein RsbU (phosphoserine phosphatase)
VLSSVRGGLYVSEDLWDQPADLLKHLNVMLKRTTEKKVFMTMAYLVFEVKNRQLLLANAGHQPVMHFRAATQDVVELRYPALPLGGVKRAEFPVHEVAFNRGDVFLIYTDGLNEAFNTKGQDFTVARVLASFQKLALKGDSSRQICDALWSEVSRFMNGEVQADDITLVAVRIL